MRAMSLCLFSPSYGILYSICYIIDGYNPRTLKDQAVADFKSRETTRKKRWVCVLQAKHLYNFLKLQFLCVV